MWFCGLLMAHLWRRGARNFWPLPLYLSAYFTSKSHTNAMFTNTPPRDAPQAAARLNGGACTFATTKIKRHVNQHRSIATQALHQGSPTLVTPAAVPQGTQSVKWQAHKELRNGDAITVV